MEILFQSTIYLQNAELDVSHTTGVGRSGLGYLTEKALVFGAPKGVGGYGIERLVLVSAAAVSHTALKPLIF